MGDYLKLNPITGKLDFVVDPTAPGISHSVLDDLLAPADDHEQYALLAGRNGGQILIGGTLTTQNLILRDNAVDANQVTLTQTGLVPGVTANLDLGTSSLFWRTLYLQYDNQPVITMAHAGIVGSHTDYTIDAGGGDLYGGILLFQFHPAFQSQGSENRFIIDYGVVDVLAAQHAYIFRSTGNAPIVGDLQVETLFGGILGDGNLGIKFSSSGYFCYRNVINSNMAFGGNEIVAGTDPQGSGFGGQNLAAKNFQIQMDGNVSYMINSPIGWNTFYGGVVDMSPSASDYGVVAVGNTRTQLNANENSRSSLFLQVPTYDLNGNSLNYAAALVINGVPTGGAGGNCGILMGAASSIMFGFGFGGVGPQFVGGHLFGEDHLISSAQTANIPLAFQLIPNGTSEKVRLSISNNPNVIIGPTYARLDVEVNAAVCNIMLRQSGAVTPITTMNIGGDATSGLALINFNLVNVPIVYIDATGLVIPSDSDGLFLGASQDVSLIYTGSVLAIDVSLQNPSDIDITCGAQKTVRLVNTVWDDLRIHGLAVGTNPSTAPTLGAFLGAGGLNVYRFIGTGVLVEEVFLTVQLPHTYKEGTDIKPHVHWTPTDANAGNVYWQMEYTWVNINGTFPASTTIGIADAASGTAWDHQVAPFAAISGAGKTISSMLVVRLFRDPANGSDTYGFDAAFLEFDVHFEVETQGSRQEFIK